MTLLRTIDPQAFDESALAALADDLQPKFQRKASDRPIAAIRVPGAYDIALK